MRILRSVAALAAALFLAASAQAQAPERRDVKLGVGGANSLYYLPLALAIFLGATGLLIAVAGRRSPRLGDTRWPELMRAAVILVACGFAAIALERLGYRLTMAALLVFFLGVVERKKPVVAVAIAIGFSLVSYLVFATWLRVPLPLGPGGI